MKLRLFSKEVTKDDLIREWTEKRPLPMGRQEFEVWSDRIIKAAMIDADVESQKFALADMIMHLGPAEDHKEDAHFIKYLRKVAVNQVADAMRREIKEKKTKEAQAKMAAQTEEASSGLQVPESAPG